LSFDSALPFFGLRRLFVFGLRPSICLRASPVYLSSGFARLFVSGFARLFVFGLRPSICGKATLFRLPQQLSGYAAAAAKPRVLGRSFGKALLFRLGHNLFGG